MVALWWGACAGVGVQSGETGGAASAADTDSGSASTPPETDFDGRFTIASLTAEQQGPWIVVSLDLEPDVTVPGVFLQGWLYFADRRIAGFVDVVEGSAEYRSLVSDPCGWYGDIEYIDLEIGGDSGSAVFTHGVERIWYVEEIPWVGDGAMNPTHIALCDEYGAWPDEWRFYLQSPGGRVALVGRGTVTHASGDVIVLTDLVEEHVMENGLWFWHEDLDHSNETRQVYRMGDE